MKLISEFFTSKALNTRVLQFGQGNFLRAFFDSMVDEYNEKCDGDLGIVIVKNTKEGDLSVFTEQNNLYTVISRVERDGEEVFDCQVITSITDAISPYIDYDRYISYAGSRHLRFIVSNTTEVGLLCSKEDRFEDSPPESYPAKLTQFLYTRYCFFGGDLTKGLIILPTELIDNNGSVLKNSVKQTIDSWNLSSEFSDWLDKSCIFCCTLVDRIVSGFPENADGIFKLLGYQDNLLTSCEPYSLLVIESDEDISEELPLDKAGLPVIFTTDASPYRKRKLHILNGTHTAAATIGLLLGIHTVYDMMQNIYLNNFITYFLVDEVFPTIDMSKQELKAYARSVFTRFHNVYLNHSLEAISTFAISKYIVRILPCLEAYYASFNVLPTHMIFSLAAILVFYQNSYTGEIRISKDYEIKESAQIMQYIQDASEHDNYIELILSNREIWGRDLNNIEGLISKVDSYARSIKKDSIRTALYEVISDEK